MKFSAAHVGVPSNIAYVFGISGQVVQNREVFLGTRKQTGMGAPAEPADRAAGRIGRCGRVGRILRGFCEKMQQIETRTNPIERRKFSAANLIPSI